MAELTATVGPTSSGADVVHVDMDAFFASVEVLDRPELVGRPVIVGGTGSRGVVAACTYEARRYGVHSAMPMSLARRACPGAVVLPGRFDRYREISDRLHRILLDVTPIVERIALDEAFLDVSGAHRLFGDTTAIAHLLHDRVAGELHLPCSVGAGPVKFIAKLASEAAKPSATPAGITAGAGVVVVGPAEVNEFLEPHPVGALWGVGPVAARRLASIGVATVGDLAGVPEHTIVRLLGARAGGQLARLARGLDDRPVVPDRPHKSVGKERTFPVDEVDPARLHQHLVGLVDGVADHLRSAHLAGRTVVLKVRTADFATSTRSHTSAHPVDTPAAILAVASGLLESVDASPGIRLLGVSVTGIAPAGADPGGASEISQLAFALEGPGAGPGGEGGPTPGRPAVAVAGAGAQVAEAVDAVRSRYGRTSLRPAVLVSDSDGSSRPGVPARTDPGTGPLTPQ